MLTLTSSAFEDGGTIPEEYTCDGENASPDLSISDVPAGTKSLALILHDPDAPGKGFTHWVVWNISPARADFPLGEAPAMSTEGKNGSGETGYIGPCPPSGTHHYEFHLYALDETINLPEGSSAKDLQAEIKDHVIEETVLVGLYSRKTLDRKDSEIL